MAAIAEDGIVLLREAGLIHAGTAVAASGEGRP
jgi:hypothetical protein